MISSYSYSPSQPSLAPAELFYQRDLPALQDLQNYLLQVVPATGSETVANTAATEATSPANPANFYQNYQHLTISTSTHDNRQLRIVVLNRDALVDTQPLHFVGFFGTKKEFIRPELKKEITQLDRILVLNMEDYPFILAYCSIELPDRYNYANLVLFSQLEGIKNWKETYYHKKAAQHVSPDYYKDVRIHFGKLEQGLASKFALSNTNFYNFTKPTHGVSH